MTTSATEGGVSRCYIYEPVPISIEFLSTIFPIIESIIHLYIEPNTRQNSNILYPKGATYGVVAIVILGAILVTILGAILGAILGTILGAMLDIILGAILVAITSQVAKVDM